MNSETFYRGITYEVTVVSVADGQWEWSIVVPIDGENHISQGTSRASSHAEGDAKIAAEILIDARMPK